MENLLAAALVVTPLVIVYLLLIKSADRYEPEPWWLLLVCFGWGAVGATMLALVGNALGSGVLGWALDARTSHPFIQASTASFVAPIVEEATKGGALLVLWAASSLWLKELDGAMDGVIYGGLIGLGFTLTEDILYVSQAADEQGFAGFTMVFLLRTVLAGLGHATFTAMTGLGVGVASEAKGTLIKWCVPALGYCAAVGLHAIHNILVTFFYNDGWGLAVKLLGFWFLDALFFVLLLALAARDRGFVVRGLREEVGPLIHILEFERTVSWWMMLPLWNFFALFGSRSGYLAGRRKQRDMVDLAFLKRRRAVGDGDLSLHERERELRHRIAQASARGVFVGTRPR